MVTPRWRKGAKPARPANFRAAGMRKLSGACDTKSPACQTNGATRAASKDPRNGGRTVQADRGHESQQLSWTASVERLTPADLWHGICNIATHCELVHRFCARTCGR